MSMPCFLRGDKVFFCPLVKGLYGLFQIACSKTLSKTVGVLICPLSLNQDFSIGFYTSGKLVVFLLSSFRNWNKAFVGLVVWFLVTLSKILGQYFSHSEDHFFIQRIWLYFCHNIGFRIFSPPSFSGI